MHIYDIHCHILPGLDDGAFLPDESVMMAEMAAENGTRAIVCTPHWMPGIYSRSELLQAYRRFGRILQERGIALKLALGQEILLDEDYRETVRMLERSELLTINNSVYPLIEFDPLIREEKACKITEYLCACGFRPIIAHPERYAFADEDHRALQRLRRSGALLQINKGSAAGFFGRGAKYASDYMLRERLADFAASDAHSPYNRTTPLSEFHEYVSEFCSVNYADHIFSKNPLRVLRNEEIHPY